MSSGPASASRAEAATTSGVSKSAATAATPDELKSASKATAPGHGNAVARTAVRAASKPAAAAGNSRPAARKRKHFQALYTDNADADSAKLAATDAVAQPAKAKPACLQGKKRRLVKGAQQPEPPIDGTAAVPSSRVNSALENPCSSAALAPKALSALHVRRFAPRLQKGKLQATVYQQSMLDCLGLVTLGPTDTLGDGECMFRGIAQQLAASTKGSAWALQNSAAAQQDFGKCRNDAADEIGSNSELHQQIVGNADFVMGCAGRKQELQKGMRRKPVTALPTVIDQGTVDHTGISSHSANSYVQFSDIARLHASAQCNFKLACIALVLCLFCSNTTAWLYCLPCGSLGVKVLLLQVVYGDQGMKCGPSQRDTAGT